MLEKFLRKRTIIPLLVAFILLPTIVAIIFHYNFSWWFEKSSFFAITVIIGIYIGQLSTVYKIKHIVETRVDELVNKLAAPKINRLDDPDLERDAFEEFGSALLKLLCEDFNYQGGVIHIFNESLKPVFRQSLYGSNLSLALTIEDYEFMRETCARASSGPISMYIDMREETASIVYSKRSEFNTRRRLDKDSDLLKFEYIRLLPIFLENSYLGYIGLCRKDKPSALENLLETIQILSERSILKAIEDKKIDDAIKNFLFRQTLLQVFLTLTYLDRVDENYEALDSAKKVGDAIVDVLRDCWKFNACLIITSDDQISCNKDDDVNMNIIQSKLIPRIRLRLGNDNSSSFYHGGAAEVSDGNQKPGFQEFISLKIQKNKNPYGYLIATSKRRITDFEKQLLVILENYKIDDAYELIEARQKKTS